MIGGHREEARVVDGEYLPLQLDNIPDILNGVAEFATGYTSAQAVVAYTDSVVLEAIGEVIVTFSHCTNKDANALFWSYVFNVVLDPDNVRIVAECDLAAVRGQVFCDWILDDLEKFFLRIGRTDR